MLNRIMVWKLGLHNALVEGFESFFWVKKILHFLESLFTLEVGLVFFPL